MSNSQDRWHGWSDCELKGAAMILGDMLDAIGPIGNPQAARQHLAVCNEMAYREAMALLPHMVMVHVNGHEQIDPEWADEEYADMMQHQGDIDMLQSMDDASSRGQ